MPRKITINILEDSKYSVDNWIIEDETERVGIDIDNLLYSFVLDEYDPRLEIIMRENGELTETLKVIHFKRETKQSTKQDSGENQFNRR